MICSRSAKSPAEGAHDQFVALFGRFVAFSRYLLEMPPGGVGEMDQIDEGLNKLIGGAG